MSANQSRGERSEGQLRRAGSGGGRSGASAHHHRGYSGRGAAAPAPQFSSAAAAPQPLLTNRSLKKSSNVHGGQSRVSYSLIPESGGASATHVAAQNGVHAQAASHGDASKQFTLQFGTISPRIQAMQIPARTSSAPPNLDEQKRDQARHDSFRAVPTLPMPSASKPQPQQTRKDTSGVNQSNSGEPHPPTQIKRDVHSQFPVQQPGKLPGQQCKSAAVKITHPETHEELRLDKRTDAYSNVGASGQRPLPNLTSQSQPGPAFTPSHQINYYPSLQSNSYNPSPMFYPNPTSLPMMTSGLQAPRYPSYPFGQSGQTMSFINHSVLNPMTGSKPMPSPMHSASEGVNLEALPIPAPPAPIQVTIKPAVSSITDKVGMPPVTISRPISKVEVSELVRQSGESSVVDRIATSSVMISSPLVRDEVQKSLKPHGEVSVVDKIGRPSIVISKPESPKPTKPSADPSIHQQMNNEIAIESSAGQQKCNAGPSDNNSLLIADKQSGSSSVLSVRRIQPETSLSPVPVSREIEGSSMINISSSSSDNDEEDHELNYRRCLDAEGNREEKRDVEKDCFILDSDSYQNLTVYASNLFLSDHQDEDVVVIAEQGQVACRDYPHSRHLCVKYPFNKTDHENYCSQCYCYVCDAVAPCEYWQGTVGHCHASDKEMKWNERRKSLRTS